MHIITFEQRDLMLAAQDREARGFWAYPDADWQRGFQAQFLLERFHVEQARTPDGLVWGE